MPLILHHEGSWNRDKGNTEGGGDTTITCQSLALVPVVDSPMHLAWWGLLQGTVVTRELAGLTKA